MNIAVLGATSHIAKGLIDRFLHRGGDYLHLFVRSPGKLQVFLDALPEGLPGSYTVHPDYRNFADGLFDAIVNCVGVETRNSHDCDFTRYFSVTETFDNLAIDYLKEKNPVALYVSFSSGALYGGGFERPATDDSANLVRVNGLAQADFYGIARINAEAKHRAHANLNIVDLRVFAYFSRYISLDDGHFITDLIRAIQNDTVLVTDSRNIVRDYLHPEDLFRMVLACIEAGRLNRPFDVNSSQPAAKQEILDYFAQNYGLRYETRECSANVSATGLKTNYYSVGNSGAPIGFTPRYSSLDALKDEARFLLPGKDGFKENLFSPQSPQRRSTGT